MTTPGNEEELDIFMIWQKELEEAEAMYRPATKRRQRARKFVEMYRPGGDRPTERVLPTDFTSDGEEGSATGLSANTSHVTRAMKKEVIDTSLLLLHQDPSVPFDVDGVNNEEEEYASTLGLPAGNTGLFFPKGMNIHVSPTKSAHNEVFSLGANSAQTIISGILNAPTPLSVTLSNTVQFNFAHGIQSSSNISNPFCEEHYSASGPFPNSLIHVPHSPPHPQEDLDINMNSADADHEVDYPEDHLNTKFQTASPTSTVMSQHKAPEVASTVIDLCKDMPPESTADELPNAAPALTLMDFNTLPAPAVMNIDQSTPSKATVMDNEHSVSDGPLCLKRDVTSDPSTPMIINITQHTSASEVTPSFTSNTSSGFTYGKEWNGDFRIESNSFKIPDDLLSWTFRYEKLTHVDPPMRLLEEDDAVFNARKVQNHAMHVHADARRQYRELNAIIDAIKAGVAQKVIPEAAGIVKVNSLTVTLSTHGKVIPKLRSTFEQKKKAYHSAKAASDGQRECLELEAELEELQSGLGDVPEDQLSAYRASIVATSTRLEDLRKKLNIGPLAAKGKARERMEEEESMSTRYWRLGPNERAAFTEKGKKALTAYINASTPEEKKHVLSKLDAMTRHAVREVREFLPECACISQEVAYGVHYTERKNVVCRFHQARRARKECDNHAAWVGVGFSKRIAKSSNSEDPPAGHMHCGCSIEDVLIEFYFWKWGRAMSSNPKLAFNPQTQEAIFHFMDDDEIINPRIRAFWVQTFKASSGLGLEDLYGTQDPTSPAWSTRMMARSLSKQVAALNARGIPVKISCDDAKEQKVFEDLVLMTEV